MSIMGGWDVHRNQLTFDYVETATGRLERGRIAPADRERLAGWLTRFDTSRSRCCSGGPRWSSTATCGSSTPGGRSVSMRPASTRAPLRWAQAGMVRASRARLMRIVSEQLSPAGRLHVNTALSVMDTLDEHLGRLRQRIVATAGHVAGAQALMDAIYGVGRMTRLALVCWLGGADRFSSSRKR